MGPGGDDFGDPGVVQLGERFRLSKNPFGWDVFEVAGVDELHRQLPLRRGLIDHPNFTKSAPANLPDQLEFTHLVPGSKSEGGKASVFRPRRDGEIVLGPGHEIDHMGGERLLAFTVGFSGDMCQNDVYDLGSCFSCLFPVFGRDR
jgi:hypothetical protein